MKNLPAVREFSVPEFTSKERSPMLKASLAGYTNLLVYSVLMLLTGLVVGLEQGRKPLVKEMQDNKVEALRLQKVDTIKTALKTDFIAPPSFKDFRLVETEGSFEIHFGTAELFERGQANLSAPSEAAVLKLARIIFPAAPESQIQIEAFTDDSPMQAGSWQYPTNWELSGARAARFLRIFNKAGFTKLTFVGYGEQHPLFPNKDEKGVASQENRMRNRRVVIRFSSL